MREFRIDSMIDRNAVLTSYLLSVKFPLEDRKDLYAGLMQTNMFPEYQYLWGGNDFFSPEHMRSNWMYAFDDIEMTLKDVQIYFSKELEFRKKKSLLGKLASYDKDLEQVSLHDLQNDVLAMAEEFKHDRGDVEIEQQGQKIYEAQKNAPLGLRSGVEAIDNVTRGFSYGTVTCIFGYVSHCKTTLMMNTLYSSIESGYGSVFVTLEVPKKHLYLQLLSIHSYKAAVRLGGGPVPYQDILKGTLNSDQEKYLFEVVEPDLKKMRGKFVFAEYEDVQDFSLAGLKNFIAKLGFEVDVFITDYINCLFPYVADKNYYYGIARLIEDFKRLAVGSNGKERMVVIGAQANREGWQQAVENDGKYEVSALAEANQLEKVSYYVISLFLDDKLRESREIKVCLLKHRGGDLITKPVIVPTDLRYYSIGSGTAGSSISVGVNDVESILSGNFSLESMINANR